MKITVLFTLLSLGALMPAPAAIFSVGDVNGSGTALNEAIPDAQYPVGISSSIDVSGAEGPLTGVTVTLNIAGGWNGDLYGYLSYNGTLVTLLNHVGTGSGDAVQFVAGFSTSGFNNITLADSGAGGNIHDVETPVSGISYGADGGTLASYNGMDPNGTWTLFLADSSAPNQSTLEGWSLVTEVPEPVNIALAVFGAVFVALSVARWCFSSKSLRRRQTPADT